jgi:catechol 2,3-dioxygenase-like lactoylglutathione lyase family enzyme
MRFSRVDHVGFSVAHLDRSVDWYTFLFQEPPMRRKHYDVEYVSRVVGYPGAVFDAALWQLPGGWVFELLEYKHPRPQRVDMETYNVGNGHLCLIVDDLAAEFERLRGHAAFRDPEPVEIPWGHFAGGKSCYLRDPDGISIELVQYPPGGPRHDA